MFSTAMVPGMRQAEPPTYLVPCTTLGTSLEQLLDNAGVASLGSVVQRCAPYLSSTNGATSVHHPMHVMSYTCRWP